ncbi:MAG: SH3 domain-containing protein [Elusimicrobiota bacterium]|jgi:SH3-like domain-containing protein
MTRPRTLLILALLAFLASPPYAQTPEKEFYSVKPVKVSVREEPETTAKKLWTMWKFCPVEVVSYRGDWVRVRDFEGDLGWLRKVDLSEIPTVAVVRKDVALRKSPAKDGKVLWLLEKGYALRVFGAKGDWLEVSDLDSASGWLRTEDAWGAPPPPSAPPER